MSPAEAVALQRELALKVETADRFGPVERIAGVDVGFEDDGRVTRAAVVVLDAASLAPLESAVARLPTAFPYIPGLLSFREAPAILEALGKLCRPPDLLLVDGQGTAHPRRCGLACHLGVVADIPSIGVAKSRLVGTHADLPPEKGAWVPLVHRDEVIGAVLRSRTGVTPLYVSPGHRVSLETAVALTLACTTRYRLPETTRAAHHLASVVR